MSNHVFIASSLDGYIAAPGGDIQWLEEIPNPSGSDYGYVQFIGSIDAVVMGRKTFEKVAGFAEWPYPKPVFVLSRTLKQVPERFNGKVELLDGTPGQIVLHLAEQGYHELYVDGGEVIREFLAEDLVDTMTITWVPILLGDGIPLFVKSSIRCQFKLAKTEEFNHHLIQAVYKRVREV
jgi:dihydrofolate reductase